MVEVVCPGRATRRGRTGYDGGRDGCAHSWNQQTITSRNAELLPTAATYESSSGAIASQRPAKRLVWATRCNSSVSLSITNSSRLNQAEAVST